MALQMQPNHLRNLFLVPYNIGNLYLLYDINVVNMRFYGMLLHCPDKCCIRVNDFVMSIKFPIRFYVNFVVL